MKNRNMKIPNEEITCSLEKINEEQEPPHESMEPTIIPRTRKIPT
jgi:hypothetical protein